MRAVLGLLVLLLMLGGAGAWWGLQRYEAPGPLAASRAIVVPRGGSDDIADALMTQGVLTDRTAFNVAALLTRHRGPLRAGELEFPAQASLRQVLDVLRTGRPVLHRVTIPEGLTAAQVVLLLDRAPALDGEMVMPPEGSLLPETYVFERGTPRGVIVERGRAAMGRALERAWSQRVQNLPIATAADALTLASIVERETGKVEERPRVAAVFLNRLRRGMKLQSDPTVVYGASGGLGTLDHGITRSELDRDDPYNTYRIPGLPPGPICMPGTAALRAVTQPAVTEDLFFVADGTGGHVFARTQEEHLRNVAHWREIERARPKP